MKIMHKSKPFAALSGFVFTLLFLLTFSVSAQGDAEKGATLFKTHCMACHQLDTRAVGPPLRNVADNRSKKWLHSFISNSTEFKEKDADAQAIFDEFKIPMTAFAEILSSEDIDNIIAYTSVEKIIKATPPPTDTDGTEAISNGSTTSNGEYERLEPNNTSTWWQLLITLLFVVIIYFLAKIKQNFAAIFMTIIALFSTAYFMFAYFLQIGVDTGYKPLQPIEFSHKVHAGDNGIDCEYCHSSAKHSKTSGIPTTNVCMNCHKSIDQYNGEVYGGHDKAFFDGEIAKVHAAAGWSVKDYAYTGEPKAVEWTRVHNLPDFVYYNHSQHVSAAGLECQTCHGPVEQMNRVEQFAPLTMDWCISCHKETEVKMDDNGYYSGTYEHASDAHKGMTVADMGGLECGKCHY